ncbi:hypothetical protein QO003_002017 [Arthrobacter silviterrae]|uniref:Uncharacterized protein n=1 Tax=Arthrobacter silviterrae TaxID=2026658 RepID=A0ABX0DEZ7_9MICC|nr:hypothetical protein [Arthrobacter silviterrae]MDQ0277714.1 hypothetical protein [Arthrobacter silviterrae]NGN85429.1 hypothetical protein [Arthrobacter silviterrae]
MEYLVLLLILLVIVVAVGVGSRFLGRKGRALQDSADPKPRRGSVAGRAASADPAPKARRRGREVTREMAVEASARLSPEAHRSVYSLIAQHQVLNAVREYRKAAHVGLGDAAAAVAALAEFPQPSPEPAPGQSQQPSQQPAAGKTPRPGQSGKPSKNDASFTVEDIINAAPSVGAAPVSQAPASYRYRAIVSRGDEVREVASTGLNEEIFRTIRSLAQGGDYDAAASLLREHADIGEADAREFVAMIGPED